MIIMKKIIVIGTYGAGETVSDGQINKVRDYYRYIKIRYGEGAVKRVNIGEYKSSPLKTFNNLLKGIRWCEKIVLLLCGDGNGIKLIFPFIITLAKKFNKSLYLSVVGGGMLNDIDNKKKLINQLQSIDGVYVETKTMKKALEEMGISNVHYAPVFSKRDGITVNELPKEYKEPFQMCTYARVIKEKGISDAIDAVVETNKRFGRMACVLDIYGDPVGDYAIEFNEKLKIAGECVRCNPLLNDSNAIRELSKHYLLLFPTFYKGEGFPIALIESMKAGLPIVATDWHFNAEIIEDGVTGRIYKRDGERSLDDIVFELVNKPEMVQKMRIECIKEAEKYNPDSILKDLYYRLET